MMSERELRDPMASGTRGAEMGHPGHHFDDELRNEGGNPAAQIVRDPGRSQAALYRRSRAFTNQQGGSQGAKRPRSTSLLHTRRSVRSFGA